MIQIWHAETYIIWLFDGSIMIANFYFIVFLISILLTVHILVKNRKIDNIFILFCFLLNLNIGLNIPVTNSGLYKRYKGREG